MKSVILWKEYREESNDITTTNDISCYRSYYVPIFDILMFPNGEIHYYGHFLLKKYQKIAPSQASIHKLFTMNKIGEDSSFIFRNKQQYIIALRTELNSQHIIYSFENQEEKEKYENFLATIQQSSTSDSSNADLDNNRQSYIDDLVLDINDLWRELVESTPGHKYEDYNWVKDFNQEGLELLEAYLTKFEQLMEMIKKWKLFNYKNSLNKYIDSFVEEFWWKNRITTTNEEEIIQDIFNLFENIWNTYSTIQQELYYTCQQLSLALSEISDQFDTLGNKAHQIFTWLVNVVRIYQGKKFDPNMESDTEEINNFDSDIKKTWEKVLTTEEINKHRILIDDLYTEFIDLYSWYFWDQETKEFFSIPSYKTLYQMSIVELKTNLMISVGKWDYEEAAKIREEILRREQENHSSQ